MRSQLNTCPLTVADPFDALRSNPVRSIKFPECNGPYFFCLDVSVELTPPFSSLDRCGACRIVVDVLAHDRPAALGREHARQVDPLPLDRVGLVLVVLRQPQIQKNRLRPRGRGLRTGLRVGRVNRRTACPAWTSIDAWLVSRCVHVLPPCSRRC